ncbi:MAG: phospholipase D-like domain-containing protein, partial [Pseudomonadota bacterium]|nr:phospholipase D-like domain-containing protein [Pseudomonadota bacterium]
WNDEQAYPISTLVSKPPPADRLAELRRDLDFFFEEQQDSAYLSALRDSQFVREASAGKLAFIWGSAEVVADDPAKLRTAPGDKAYLLAPHLDKYFKQAREEVIVASAYFVPGKEGVAFFRELEERGVQVSILTNSLTSTDVPIVHSGYAKYRKPLLKAGVELYEMSRQSDMNPELARSKFKGKFKMSGSSQAGLHAKSFVIDRKVAFIGTLNLDPRSVIQNTEIGMVISAPKLGAQMAENFHRSVGRRAFRVTLDPAGRGRGKLEWRIVEEGREKRFTSEPYSSFWQRFMVGFLRIFPIDSQI